MNFSAEIWAEKRKRGLVRYLLIDGILFTGGPFAVVMQIIRRVPAACRGADVRAVLYRFAHMADLYPSRDVVRPDRRLFKVAAA